MIVYLCSDCRRSEADRYCWGCPGWVCPKCRPNHHAHLPTKDSVKKALA